MDSGSVTELQLFLPTCVTLQRNAAEESKTQKHAMHTYSHISFTKIQPKKKIRMEISEEFVSHALIVMKHPKKKGN